MTAEPQPPSAHADRVTPPTAPATGAVDPYFTELAPGEEPVVVGTLFLSMVILMIIAGFWVIIYLQLIGR